jgi:alpha-amylase
MATGNRICMFFQRYWQPLGTDNDNRYNVNPKLGTADDIKALSKALHERGMYLMIDVVANHMVRS